MGPACFHRWGFPYPGGPEFGAARYADEAWAEFVRSQTSKRETLATTARHGSRP